MEVSYICSEKDENELYIIGISSIVISSISLISTLVSLLIYFILPNLKKNKALRLISYLLASNALFSIGYIGSIAAETSIIIISQTSIWMNIFNIGYSFGFISGINLTLVFSLNLYFEVYHKKSLDEFEKLMIFSCFAIAAIITIFLLYLPHQLFFIILFIDTLYKIFVMIANIWLYIRVILAFNKISYPDITQCMKDLAIYPLVGMVMLILFYLQQILSYVQNCISTYYLIIFGIRSLQGFIDVVIYGFNTTVRAEINKKFQKQQVNINVPIYDDSNQDQYIY